MLLRCNREVLPKEEADRKKKLQGWGRQTELGLGNLWTYKTDPWPAGSRIGKSYTSWRGFHGPLHAAEIPDGVWPINQRLVQIEHIWLCRSEQNTSGQTVDRWYGKGSDVWALTTGLSQGNIAGWSPVRQSSACLAGQYNRSFRSQCGKRSLASIYLCPVLDLSWKISIIKRFFFLKVLDS